jgi:hypothetical protein
MLALPSFMPDTGDAADNSVWHGDLHTDVAYTNGTTIVGDVLILVQLELEGSLDPIATTRSSVNLAAGTSNADAQGNSDNADGDSTAADEAEAVD